MKHAGTDSLAALSLLLNDLRSISTLIEKKPGIFYRKSSAYLHFHEDVEGLFADVKLDGKNFSRYPVNTSPERKLFVVAVRKNLAEIGREFC
jgi:hypothetical protein